MSTKRYGSDAKYAIQASRIPKGILFEIFEWGDFIEEVLVLPHDAEAFGREILALVEACPPT